MPLADHVQIAPHFQRSIRIDADLKDSSALEGFICPKSSADVLLSLANHISETQQGAFTWTGPYGSGKSSLVIALSALLNGDSKRRKRAEAIVGKETARIIWDAMPPHSKGWQILPLVGRRDDPIKVIGEAVEQFANLAHPSEWTEVSLISTLENIASKHSKASGGLLVFVDEMGKFLEAAMNDGSDIYIFQQLAEAASRSKGRLIFVGLLHQAFEEYAHRLSREMRDEWAKIQGRFVDLAVNTTGEEQIDLIARAIKSDEKPISYCKLAISVSKVIRDFRPSTSEHLPKMFEECWPLHPIVASLLGPISRRRFGQNQRSVFGFLNSAESNGFQDFLHNASLQDSYNPDRLWDYLRVNFESSILVSTDGHRWSLAADAIDRCEGIDENEIHLRMLKTIALIDLFKEHSGLVPSDRLLKCALPGVSLQRVKQTLEELQNASLIVYRKFSDSYAIYAGSDFDIDNAVERTLKNIESLDFETLRRLANIQPILAKRHYYNSGALRWYDVDLVPLENLVDSARSFSPTEGTIGKFLLGIPTGNESEDSALTTLRTAAKQSENWDIIVGLSKRSWTITSLARELIALEEVRNNSPELAGDAAARREVKARIAVLQDQLEVELNRAFDNAYWYRKNFKRKRYLKAELNILASQLASERFKQAPRIHNELLNRIKLSSNAVAAQKALMRRMVLNEGEPRLGIDGYPAEGGLFASLLEATGLYVKNSQGWHFATPTAKKDSCCLSPIWRATTNLLKKNRDRTVPVSEIYAMWRQPPYGVKDGLMPVLMVAFILSQKEKVAFYRQGIFQAQINDLDMDYLAKDSSDIQLRWMDLSTISQRLMLGMADIVRNLDEKEAIKNIEPIEVARGLVVIYDKLPVWTKRTARLSKNALRIRQLFKKANDPNKFLFDDIPALLGKKVELNKDAALKELVVQVHDGLNELVAAYPTMLGRLRETLLSELRVPNASPQSLSELRKRAENVRQLAGDFRIEAFVGRISRFSGSDSDIEGLATLATNKPARDLVDTDIDKAALELSDMAQKFVRIETFARIKGRPNKRNAIAVVIGIDGRPMPIIGEFDIADKDRKTVNQLIDRINAILQDQNNPHQENVILAALAELSASYIPRINGDSSSGKKRKFKAKK